MLANRSGIGIANLAQANPENAIVGAFQLFIGTFISKPDKAFINIIREFFKNINSNHQQNISKQN